MGHRKPNRRNHQVPSERLGLHRLGLESGELANDWLRLRGGKRLDLVEHHVDAADNVVLLGGERCKRDGQLGREGPQILEKTE